MNHKYRAIPLGLTTLKDGDSLQWCNLSQASENNNAFADLKNLKLINCLVNNLKIPDSWTLTNCWDNEARLNKVPDSLIHADLTKVHYRKKLSEISIGELTASSVLWQCRLVQNLQTAIAIPTGCHLYRCNALNCIFPNNPDLVKCQTAQIDFCAHLHPEKQLPSEPTECRHVTEIEEIEIDGIVVDTIYTREDIAL